MSVLTRSEYIKLWNKLPNDARKQIDDLLFQVEETRAWLASYKQDGALNDEQYTIALQLVEAITSVEIKKRIT